MGKTEGDYKLLKSQKIVCHVQTLLENGNKNRSNNC